MLIWYDTVLYQLSILCVFCLSYILISTYYSAVIQFLTTVPLPSGGCCGSDTKTYAVGGWAWAWCLISDTQRWKHKHKNKDNSCYFEMELAFPKLLEMLLCQRLLLIPDKWIILLKLSVQTHLDKMAEVFKQTTAEMGFCCLPQGSQSHYLQANLMSSIAYSVIVFM